MTKDERINKYIKQFESIYETLKPDRRKIAAQLYVEAAFLKVNLEDLKEIINREGAIVTSVNGNGFEVMSEHPAQKSYNVTIKNFNATIKGLTALLPDEVRQGGGVMEWIKETR